jgi:hypothetical protein
MRNGSPVDVSGDDWEVTLSKGTRYLKWRQTGLSEKALSGLLQYAKWVIKKLSAARLCRQYSALSAYQSVEKPEPR